MRKSLFIISALAILGFFSCANHSADSGTESSKEKEAPDSMIYGLACDGSNDSVVVLYKFSGEDPITYDIVAARTQGKVIGKPQIGDWIGVMVNRQDTTEATMVVDLDELKATWTYQVRPTWKDASKMSRRALKNRMAEMPDSLREAYMVPREYGFTLKRSSVAQSVGRIHRTSSLEDESPVEYPPVKNYTGWKCRNGRLILISSETPAPNAKPGKDKPKEIYDTLDFVFLSKDSLILKKKDGNMIHFHRQANAMTANANAQKAVQKTSSYIKR